MYQGEAEGVCDFLCLRIVHGSVKIIPRTIKGNKKWV